MFVRIPDDVSLLYASFFIRTKHTFLHMRGKRKKIMVVDYRTHRCSSSYFSLMLLIFCTSEAHLFFSLFGSFFFLLTFAFAQFISDWFCSLEQWALWQEQRSLPTFKIFRLSLCKALKRSVLHKRQSNVIRTGSARCSQFFLHECFKEIINRCSL